MGLFRRKSTWQRLSEPVKDAGGASVVRNGLTAGAALLAVSVASAVTSAMRRRGDGT